MEEVISVVSSVKMDETLGRLDFVVEKRSKKVNDVYLVNFQTVNPANV